MAATQAQSSHFEAVQVDSVLAAAVPPADEPETHDGASTPVWFRRSVLAPNEVGHPLISLSRSRAAHGPTSALFDEEEPLHDTTTTASVPEAELRDKATAASSAERHMEIINLASGRLDCESPSNRLPTQHTDQHLSRWRSPGPGYASASPALEPATLCLSHFLSTT